MVTRDIRSFIGIAAIVALGFSAVASSQAAKATGTVTVGTTKVAIANAAAVGYKAFNGQLITVLLSDKPADAKEFATDTKTGPGEPLMSGIFEGAWKSQHNDKKFSGFVFTIGPEGERDGRGVSRRRSEQHVQHRRR